MLKHKHSRILKTSIHKIKIFNKGDKNADLLRILFKTSETKDPYRDALIDVTNANSAQMKP